LEQLVADIIGAAKAVRRATSRRSLASETKAAAVARQERNLSMSVGLQMPLSQFRRPVFKTA
jgi:hypothetical protein